MNEIETIVMQSRIRSARSRIRAARKDFDKSLLRLYCEEIELQKSIRSCEWVDLDPPYQRGWNRFFVLRDDFKNDKRACLYLKLLEKINTLQWSYRKDFKKKRRKLGKKIYVVREQFLRQIGEHEFYSKQFTTDERALFYETLVYSRWKKMPEKCFVFSEPWRYVLIVKPNIVTKTQVRNTTYERRQGEIDRIFTTGHLRPRLWRLIDRTYRSFKYKEKLRYKDPLENKPLSYILNEHWNETTKSIKIESPWTTEGFLSLQWIDLFTTYKARVKLIYMEVPYREWQHQNSAREHAVPQPVILRLLNKLEVPLKSEAHEVVYEVRE